MKLDPYQQVGRDWLVAHPLSGIADDPGLGKSAQAITAADKVLADRVDVACPATGRTNWRRQFDIWSDCRHELNIESYQRIVNGALPAGRGDVLILDEAHYLKSISSQRTKHIYGPRANGAGIIKHYDHVWLLSGTIAPNANPMELYPHIRALRPDLILKNGRPMGEFDFLKEFCFFRPTLYGPKVTGVRDGARLRGITRQIFIRRTEEEVATELPEIVWEHRSVDSEEAKRVLRQLEDREEVRALIAHIEIDGDFHAYDESALATLRRLIGELKVDPICEEIADQLRNGMERVVIFCQHHAVINRVHSALNDFGVVSISGQSSERHRVESIDRFQSRAEGAPRVFIGQLDCCREVIDLTASNHVEFIESSWVPLYNYQAAKRCHRRPQTKPVFARIWGLAGSIDDLIASVCAQKVRNKKQLED